MKPIESINYSVFFENSLQELSAFLTQRKYSKVFVLVDSNTEIQCLPILQEIIILLLVTNLYIIKNAYR